MSQSYHDFNTRFFFIRTSAWARGAWGMFSSVIPEKVRDKTLFFGDDFLKAQELQKVLDASALDALRRREFGIFCASKRRVQEGLITISANDAFELPVEVPTNATLYWDFDVEGGEMEFTLFQSVPGEEDAAAELEDEDGAAPIVADKWEPIENWEALKVSGEGERTSGMLREASAAFGHPLAQSVDGRQLLLLRWDNTGAWLWSRTVRYRVQVVPPAAASAPEVRVGGSDRGGQAGSGRGYPSAPSSPTGCRPGSGGPTPPREYVRTCDRGRALDASEWLWGALCSRGGPGGGPPCSRGGGALAVRGGAPPS
ncbi:unnamed protein product [Prorocentrum cordatum]|uniref:GOLD domain-containing protein n=1 Tax=Prorocentrum cordatum TaxID=2364126 RepID=A0ABN9XNM0_9DINO|nr:unnamed protein product [Polarella glacialis]